MTSKSEDHGNFFNMNSQLIRAGILVVSLVLSLWGSIPSSLAGDRVVFEFASLEIKGRQYRLEVAKTAIQRRQGLMYRETLASLGGMLFVYADEGFHRIWMKNTLIPLTVVWVDSQQTVIHIARLDPCQSVFCPSFGADQPARYIIELAGGNRSLLPGDRIPALANFQAKE